jgi:uncharacterized protein
METAPPTVTAFAGFTRLAAGLPADVAVAVQRAQSERPDVGVLVFDNTRGSVVDLDLRGDAAAVRRRYASARTDDTKAEAGEGPAAKRGRGRTRLGVVSREVTLLPRHWDWLATQPGGASAALRRLVEDARRARRDTDAARAAREAAYRVMSALGGDLPNFEEASRALFAGDRPGFETRVSDWPADVREYLLELAYSAR